MEEIKLKEMPVGPKRNILLVDTLQKWTRPIDDLVGAGIALFGILFVVVLGIYAPTTTLAVTDDVRSVTSSMLQTLLFIPVNILESLLSFVFPLIIIIYLLTQKRWRTLLTAISAGMLAITIAQTVSWIAEKWWPQATFTNEFSSTLEVQSFIALVPYVAVISALLTVAERIQGSQLVRTSWWLLAIVLVFSVLQGEQSLTGALVTTFLGIFVGMFSRWIIGTEPQRATGEDLVKLVRKAGIDAQQIVRLDETPDEEIFCWDVTTTSPLEYTDFSGINQLKKYLTNKMQAPLDEDSTSEAQTIIETVDEISKIDGIKLAENKNAPAIRAALSNKFSIITTSTVSRNYIAITENGKAYQLLLLDEDRRIVSVLEGIWQKIKLKTVFQKTPQTIERAAEQITLTMLTAEHLKVTAPKYKANANNNASILIAIEANTDPISRTVNANEITDEQVDTLWQDLHEAHRRGLSHSHIDANQITFSENGLKLQGWYRGSTTSSDTERRIDLAQTLATLATLIGTERAVNSVKRLMTLDQIVSFVPFLQLSIMPANTRKSFSNKKEFQKLVDLITAEIPETLSAEAVTLRRFSIKTIITIIIGVVAGYLLLVSMNFNDVSKAVMNASIGWMIASFVAGLLTYLGAGMTLKAYTKERLPLGESVLIQVAASVVTLVAPAGVGPAALNLRFLQKRGVTTTPAIATVTLVQLAQFITTVTLLALLSLGSGELNTFSVPSTTILIIVITLIAILLVIFSIPKLRNWIWKKIKPTLDQIWPRMIWLGTHPQRILLGLLGSVIMTVAFVSCFGFALKAFGYDLSIVTLAITYLIANSVGSAVPSPGGIGPVEAALTGGLALAGIPYSVAFSTAVLYRLFTFWGRVPLGWLALRIAGKRELI